MFSREFLNDLLADAALSSSITLLTLAQGFGKTLDLAKLGSAVESAVKAFVGVRTLARIVLQN